MDLSKHIVKNDDGNLFHSSGFAQVASGERLGSTANVSFLQRQQIEKNRRLIAGYERSKIGQSRIKLPTRNAIKIKPVSAPISRQSRVVGGKRFIVSPARRYDPFA